MLKAFIVVLVLSSSADRKASKHPRMCPLESGLKPVIVSLLGNQDAPAGCWLPPGYQITVSAPTPHSPLA